MFNDIPNEDLRNKNRGAILANIFEKFVNQRTRCLLPKDLKMCLRELENYLSQFPRKERKSASNEMMNHLFKRGYTLGATS